MYQIGDVVRMRMQFAGELSQLPTFTAEIAAHRVHKGRVEYAMKDIRGWFPEDLIHSVLKDSKPKKWYKLVFSTELSETELDTLITTLATVLSQELRIQNCSQIIAEEI